MLESSESVEEGGEGVRSKTMRQSVPVAREGGRAGKKPTAGIIYLSRVPPFMQPRKVRHLFSKYGEVGRIFLQPEGDLTLGGV